MTGKELLNDGWEATPVCDGDYSFMQYTKRINDFSYTITDLSSNPEIQAYANEWDWMVHIDNADCNTVCSCEINSLEHIKLLSEIYK